MKCCSTKLTRISHQTLGKLGTSAFPNIPSNSFGNVYEHSLQELLEISKKQLVSISQQSFREIRAKYPGRGILLLDFTSEICYQLSGLILTEFWPFYLNWTLATLVISDFLER